MRVPFVFGSHGRARMRKRHLLGRRSAPGSIGAVLGFVVFGKAILFAGVAHVEPNTLPAAPIPPHECRFWAIVGDGYPETLIDDHLRTGTIENLRALGESNPDGWGIAFFTRPDPGWPSLRPIVRRGGPKASHPSDPDYSQAVDELLSDVRRSAVAHVRTATSAHSGIPDPHPFLERFGARDICFAHNGGLRVDGLLPLLEDFLPAHPPDYVQSSSATGPIGAELYCLFLKMYVEAHPDLGFAEALRQAIAELAGDPNVTGDTPRMNFALSNGDTLYALHLDASDNPVRFYPPLPRVRPSGPGSGPTYWVVASEVLGFDPNWSTIPPWTLAVFVPGREPTFLPISPAAPGSNAVGARTAAPATPPSSQARADHNCRLWGLIGSGYPLSLFDDQLMTGSVTNLRELGGMNPDGWGFAAFPSTVVDLGLNGPIVRRGGPEAPDDEDYPRAVAELREAAPRAAIGHVRSGTSGHWGIPNPHPFVHRDLVFAHNGVLSVSGLEARLGDDLESHPPDYTEAIGDPYSGHIDSELYLLYILSLIGENPAGPLADHLRVALQAIGTDPSIVGGYPRLNFVMTDGDTLYALHWYGSGTSNALWYYPGGRDVASSFWAVASQPMGDTEEGWARIPGTTLAVFVSGQPVRLLPVEGVSFAWLSIAGVVDADDDDWFPQFEILCDPQTSRTDDLVTLWVHARRPNGERVRVARSEPFWIHSNQADTARVLCEVDSVDAELRAEPWNLSLVLRSADGDSAVVTWATHPELAAFPVECSARDRVSDEPHDFLFTAVSRSANRDEDHDGNVAAFDLEWNLDLPTSGDSALTYVRACYARLPRLIELGRTEEEWMHGGGSVTRRLSLQVVPEDQEPVVWDLALELYDVNDGRVAARAWWSDYADLNRVPVEGWTRDSRGLLGSASPNPSGAASDAGFVLQALVPDEGARLQFRVWDAAGRLIWLAEPVDLDGGAYEIVWPACDREGRPVSGGVYFGEVVLGARSWSRRLVVVR